MQVSEYNGGASINIPKLVESKLAKGYRPYSGVAHPSASMTLSPSLKAWLKKQTPSSNQTQGSKKKDSSAKCPAGQLRNPASGRCVSRSGSTGRRLLSKPRSDRGCAGDKVRNPASAALRPSSISSKSVCTGPTRDARAGSRPGSFATRPPAAA